MAIGIEKGGSKYKKGEIVKKMTLIKVVIMKNVKKAVKPNQTKSIKPLDTIKPRLLDNSVW